MAIEKPVKIGVFGGEGTHPGDIDPNQLPWTLEKIEIWSSANRRGSGAIINGIRFTYTDYSGNKHTVPIKDGNSETCWGTIEGNPNSVPIDVERGDYVKHDGSFRKDRDDKFAITSLKFATKNHINYGPYGDPDNGTPFSVPLNNAGVYAFFGNYGSCLNGLGFYAHQPDAENKKA